MFVVPPYRPLRHVGHAAQSMVAVSPPRDDEENEDLNELCRLIEKERSAAPVTSVDQQPRRAGKFFQVISWSVVLSFQSHFRCGR